MSEPQQQPQAASTETPAETPPTPEEQASANFQAAVDAIKIHDNTDPLTGVPVEPTPEPAAENPDQPPADDVLVAAAAEAKKYRDAQANMKAQRAQLSEKMEEWERLVQQVKTPEGALEFAQKYGGDDWLLRAAENAQKAANPTPETKYEALEQKYDALLNKFEELTQGIKKRDETAEVSSFKYQINQLMASDPKYGIVAEDPVALSELEKFIEVYHKEQGTLLNLPAQGVLDRLLENQVNRLEALSKHESWRMHLGGQSEAPPPTPAPQQANGQPPGPSQTNNMPVRNSPPVEDDYDPRDEEARLAAAAAVLRFLPE